MLSLMMKHVGDKINPEDTWILILKHLGVTSRIFVKNSRKGCLGIMTPRSYRTQLRQGICRDLQV
jgi:hypothetical protein